MASPTTRGKYKKQALGEGLNTWGLASGLNGLFDVMDEALHGVNEITLTGTAYTLTSTNYTTNDIRFRQFKFTGNFAATITIPATQNWWIIENATGQTLTFDNGSNTATLQTGFFGLLVTNGTTVTCLTLPDGVNAKTVADNIASVNQVATDSASVIAVAAKSTEVGRLGTADAVADMAILGTPDVVADMNTLATADVVADMNTLGTADVVTDMNTLATADVVADMNTLATADVVADMNTLGTADVVADMNALATTDVLADMAALAETDVLADMAALAETDVLADMALLGTTDVIADMALLATTDVIADMNTLGTADVVADMNTLATADVVADMNTLGTADVVNDMNVLGTSQNVTNMNTLAPIAGDITTTAGVSTSVTAYAKQYSAGNGDITTRGDGTGSVSEGDIRFRTDTDTMRVYTGSNWQDVAVTAGSFLQVTNNLSDLNNAATARTNLGGVITEISQDTTPQLGGDLDMQSHSISSGVLGIKNTGSQSELRLYCETGNAHFTSIKSAPHAQYSGNLTLQLPATVGAAGQVLTDAAGNGVLAWSTPSAGGSVATQMKFS